MVSFQGTSFHKSHFFERWKWICTAILYIGMLILLFFIATDYVKKQTNFASIPRRVLNEKSTQFLYGNSFPENDCNISIVESIPDGLIFKSDIPKSMSTYDAWKTLLAKANESIHIGSFYWTLRGVDVVNHSTAIDGEDIFKEILSKGQNKKLKIRIAQNIPTIKEPNLDTEIFAEQNVADVRSVDFERLLGSGVLHTKLWVIDNKHFYLGSANMDWRSLTQVKELGVLVLNCPNLANDIDKIFNIYWYLGRNTSTIPKRWPKVYSTNINMQNPMMFQFNNKFSMSAYVASSPSPLSPYGRTNDLDAILNTISTAKEFVNIAVMDYFPLIIYTEKIKFWPYIDDALRAAAIEKHIAIKMLISWWPISNPTENNFLRSLISLTSALDNVNIKVKRFIVPSNADQSKIPFSRVNHNKYMVTDNTAFIGTSNWAGDYFTDTAGVSLILSDTPKKQKENNLRNDLLQIFNRDWESSYAHEFN